jgi:molybdate transport system regulatory protein
LPTAEIKITFARVSQPPITDAGDRIMKRKTSPARLPALHPRFRIVCRKEIAFGPGKADLLELIAETGSIGKAASRMKMSYMRAWTLVQTMNQCFNKPLILATHGGEGGGGAELTESGRQILCFTGDWKQSPPKQLRRRGIKCSRSSGQASMPVPQAPKSRIWASRPSTSLIPSRLSAFRRNSFSAIECQ